MLARVQARVEQIPKLRPLRFGLPLAEAVAVAENAFFGAGFFFVAPRTAYECIKAEFINCFKQGDRLVHVARLVWAG